MSNIEQIANLLRSQIEQRRTLAIGTAQSASIQGTRALYQTPSGIISAIATNFCYGDCLLAKVEGTWYAINPVDNREVVRGSVDRMIRRKASVFVPDRYLVIRMVSYYDPWFTYVNNQATIDSPIINYGKLPVDLYFIGIVPNVSLAGNPPSAVIFQQSVPIANNNDAQLYQSGIFQLLPSSSSLYLTTSPLTENAIGSSVAVHNGVCELQIDTEQWAGNEINIRCLPANYRRRFALGVDNFSGRATLTPPSRVEFEVESRNFRNLFAQPTIDPNLLLPSVTGDPQQPQRGSRQFANFNTQSVYTGQEEIASSSILDFSPVFRQVFYRVAFRVNYDKNTGEIRIT